MSIKTSLQQFMGGTSDIKEAFSFPGMGDIYSKAMGNEDEEGEEGENNKPVAPAARAGRAGRTGTATRAGTAGRTGTAAPSPAAAPAPAPAPTPAPAPAPAAGTAAAPAPAAGTAVAPGNVIGATQQTSNTSATMTETQTLTTTKILVFIIHVVFAIIIAYIWGILGSNALFLMTRSKNEKEYILPTYRYAPPYCITENKNASYFSYGFPYNLLPRICANNNVSDVINTEKENIYLLNEVEEGGVGNGVSQALFNYLFNAVYGGLGQGARSFAQAFLNLFDTTDSGKADNENSWDNMQVAGGRKFLIFLLFPLIALYLMPVFGFAAGIMSLVFGIVSDHPFWGIIFTLIFGFFIAFGTGIWMAIQTFYIFFLYPCLNIRNKEDYDKIFNNVRPYMLFIFYILIALYAFQDLGNSGGAGIIFFIIVAYFTGNAG
jgi:hypothetical protein